MWIETYYVFICLLNLFWLGFHESNCITQLTCVQVYVNKFKSYPFWIHFLDVKNNLCKAYNDQETWSISKKYVCIHRFLSRLLPTGELRCTHTRPDSATAPTDKCDWGAMKCVSWRLLQQTRLETRTASKGLIPLWRASSMELWQMPPMSHFRSG